MSGNYFKMSDGEQNEQEPRQSKAELNALKNQFMDRARSFMDDTALGDGKQALQKFMRKVKGEEEPPEEEPAEVLPPGETVYDDDGDYEDDDEYYYEDEKEDLDWSRPEYIHAGYAKPGTEFETARTLEDAQEESFDLKFGNLSGLLSRFGSEDAVADPEAEEARRREMDLDLFRKQMQHIYAGLREQVGQVSDELWLHPEVLTLFRGHNTELQILQFIMAALFARTDENYLLDADKIWIQELLQRAGYLFPKEKVERQLEQTFLYPERVHRLYETLLETPLRIAGEKMEHYAENLAKLFIHEMSARYEADPRTVIRVMAQQWQERAAAFQTAREAVAPAQKQYERFQNKKMTSASLFEKLRQAEIQAEEKRGALQSLALDLERLKAVTRFLQEEEALHKLEQFPTAAFLPADFEAKPMYLEDLRRAFVELQLKPVSTTAVAATPDTEHAELSPIEQKRAIGRAKEGELKSLKRIFAYKRSRLPAHQLALSE